MKATIESTKVIANIHINGTIVPARCWRGVTEGGTTFVAYVTRIMVPESSGIGPAFPKQDMADFDRELKETPGTELTVGGYALQGPIDLRLII